MDGEWTRPFVAPVDGVPGQHIGQLPAHLSAACRQFIVHLRRELDGVVIGDEDSALAAHDRMVVTLLP